MEVLARWTESVEWYTKSADAGDLTAMASIGWMQYHGLGVNKDDEEALVWLRKAAEHGNNFANQILSKLNE